MKKIDTTVIGILTTKEGREVWGVAYQLKQKKTNRSDNSFGKMEIKNNSISKKDFIKVCRGGEISIINCTAYI